MFHQFADITDGRNCVMKFLGEVPQFYCRECNKNGVHSFGKSYKSLNYDVFLSFLKVNDLNPLRHRLKNRADLFLRAVQLQYNAHMMKSDIEDSGGFFKIYPKTLSYGGKDLIITVKSHLEFHHDLKSNLPP